MDRNALFAERGTESERMRMSELTVFKSNYVNIFKLKGVKKYTHIEVTLASLTVLS
jgi:hypothetical protein